MLKTKQFRRVENINKRINKEYIRQIETRKKTKFMSLKGIKPLRQKGHFYKNPKGYVHRYYKRDSSVSQTISTILLKNCNIPKKNIGTGKDVIKRCKYFSIHDRASRQKTK